MSEDMGANWASEILDKFSQKKVIVVGDYYLDEYIYTEGQGMSPEAAVVRSVIREKKHMPGAAGNVACGFADMGSITSAISIIGSDNASIALARLLTERKKNIDTSGFIVDNSRLTGTFTRIMLKGPDQSYQHVIRIDEENTRKPSEASSASLLNLARERLEQCDVFFAADYDEVGLGTLSKQILGRMASMCREAGVLSIGISREKIALFEGFDILIMNQKEAEGAVRMKLTPANFRDAAQKLKAKLDAKCIVITLGKDGVAAYDGSELVTLPSFADEIVDVCGAGDSFSVAFSLAMSSGASLSQACELASHASAAAISKEGTATVAAKEIVERMTARPESRKIVTRQEMPAIISRLREQGKKIVFTNGYFDFIHGGHITFLREAKKNGDILVVAINSDDSTRRNKGANRPLIKEDERSRILSSFSFVDYVVTFDEMTPIKIVSEVKPDVLVKGGTWNMDDIVGRDIVVARGGRVVIIPLTGSSTESIIEHIKQSKKSLHE
jgi:D-beta-D-heptose 7-phosphate kinase / D-beta-D-heptose 1-phosphate adenosyltransferase